MKNLLVGRGGQLRLSTSCSEPSTVQASCLPVRSASLPVADLIEADLTFRRNDGKENQVSLSFTTIAYAEWLCMDSKFSTSTA